MLLIPISVRKRPHFSKAGLLPRAANKPTLGAPRDMMKSALMTRSVSAVGIPVRFHDECLIEIRTSLGEKNLPLDASSPDGMSIESALNSALLAHLLSWE